MRHEIHTEVEIDATPQRVWDVLTDAPALRRWNPVLTRLDGELAVGRRIRVDIRSGGRRLPLIVRLTKVREGEVLEWAGGVPFVFEARHGFKIESLDDARVRFVHYETFDGATIRFLGRILRRLERDYARMNDALKARAEDRD